MPRQTTFIGSTNAVTYLLDSSGNRRFWPVRIGTIRLAKIKPIVADLWAEAVAAYRSGEAWWLSARLERLAAREQQGRLELDPWYDQIADFLAASLPGAEVTIAQLLTKLGVEEGRRERAHEMRVGNVLRELGYVRRRGPRVTGLPRRWVYRLLDPVTDPDEADHERCDDEK